jgi:hypothetical protein
MGQLNRFLHRHPFDFLPVRYWQRFFWSLLGLTIVLMILFGISGVPLTTTAAPYGVISLELAGSIQKFVDILSCWDNAARTRLFFGLGLDFLFMVVYASTIAFGCGIASNTLQRKGWELAWLGQPLAWGAIFAALLDVFENISLMILLWIQLSNPWPEIARWCAIFKFALVFIGIVYVVYGGVVSLVVRISPTEEE